MTPRTTASTDAPEEKADDETDAPEEKADDETEHHVEHVHVSVGYPVSVFKHGVKDVPDLTDQPTQVPSKALPALREAAAVSRVTLIEEKS